MCCINRKKTKYFNYKYDKFLKFFKPLNVIMVADNFLFNRNIRF